VRERAGSGSRHSTAASAARRDLWLGDEGRYVRRWLLLGPVSAARADELAKSGTANRLGEDTAAGWRAQGSYGDILDGFSAAGMKDGDVGFALATVERDAAGDATLLLGGNVRGAWVNGAWVGGGENSPAFVIDGAALPVRFNAGTNRILLRVERVDRPVLLSTARGAAGIHRRLLRQCRGVHSGSAWREAAGRARTARGG
jgi:hypothetical protein